MISISMYLYMDGMLIAYKEITKIDALKNLLNTTFDMKDLGNVRKILGMEIIRNRVERSILLY